MSEELKTISDILPMVSLAGFILLYIFVYFRFAPTFRITIEPRWEGVNSEYLVIKYIAENASKIRIYHPEFLVQIALYDGCCKSSIGPRLPLDDVKGSKINADYFIGPEQINSDESKFYPGERIYWEKLYSISKNVNVAHIVLTAKVNLSLWGKIATLKCKPWTQSVSNILVKNDA